MKHIYKPILLLASLMTMGKFSEAKFTTEKISYAFGNGSITLKEAKSKGDNMESVENKHLVLKKKNRESDEMSFYPSNGLSLKTLLRTVSTTNNRRQTAIASMNGANEEGVLNVEVKGVVVENFAATCVDKKQYFLSWQSTTQNSNGQFAINYVNSKGKVQTVYQTVPKQGVKSNYSAFVTVQDALDKPTFNLVFEDLNKQSVGLASANVNSDSDGEMVDLVGHQQESALFVKTIAGTGGTYKLDVYDESGKLVMSNEEIEIMGGSSQLIPMDLPQTEHGTYLAVLSNSGSKKKKKTFKIAH